MKSETWSSHFQALYEIIMLLGQFYTLFIAVLCYLLNSINNSFFNTAAKDNMWKEPEMSYNDKIFEKCND